MSVLMLPTSGNGTIARDDERPKVASAAERAVDAAQRIAVERIELAWLETREAAGRLAGVLGLLAVAAFVALAGWCAISVAAVVLLAERTAPAASIALVGACNAVGGLLVVWIVMDRLRTKS